MGRPGALSPRVPTSTTRSGKKSSRAGSGDPVFANDYERDPAGALRKAGLPRAAEDIEAESLRRLSLVVVREPGTRRDGSRLSRRLRRDGGCSPALRFGRQYEPGCNVVLLENGQHNLAGHIVAVQALA